MNTNQKPSQKFIKLSIFTQFYPPDYAATGQLIEELASQLANLDITLQIFTGQPGYAFQNKSAPNIEHKEQIIVRRSRTARLWPQRIRGKAVNGVLFCLRSALHLFRRILKLTTKNQEKNEILLLTTAPPFLPILGYLFNLICNLPYICLLYDLYPDVAVELKVLKSNDLLVKFWENINRRIWQKATRIIVLSPAMKDRIIDKCPEVKDKIVVIHNWADPNWIKPMIKAENWFAKTHNLTDKFTVLYSGNMGRCHDMDTILQTAIILQDKPVQFVFIGSGAKREYIQQQVEDLKLTNCKFLPYQNKNDLPYSLTSGDLSLVSVMAGMEGIVVPSKLYPALAAGLPIAVICEPNFDLYNLVVNQAHCGGAFNNGESEKLANFILYLAKNKDIATEMGQSGRNYLKSHFTPEIIAEQYSQVFFQALYEECEKAPDKSFNMTSKLPS